MDEIQTIITTLEELQKKEFNSHVNIDFENRNQISFSMNRIKYYEDVIQELKKIRRSHEIRSFH